MVTITVCDLRNVWLVRHCVVVEAEMASNTAWQPPAQRHTQLRRSQDSQIFFLSSICSVVRLGPLPPTTCIAVQQAWHAGTPTTQVPVSDIPTQSNIVTASGGQQKRICKGDVQQKRSITASSIQWTVDDK